MKKFLSIALFTAMILTLFAFPTSAAWDGTSVSASLKGEGTQASPYLVESAADLAFLAKSVNEGNSYEGKYIIQTADIDLGGKAWTPIGQQKVNSIETDAPFAGVYSGLGHKVTGLSFTGTPDYHIGLFGYVMSGAVQAGIANLTVEGTISFDGISASNFGVAGIVGSLGKDSAFQANVVIKNCTSNVTITLTNCSGEPRVGGIAGYIYYGLVENCVSNGDISVSATNQVRAGGITGQTNRTYFRNCVNNGNITSEVAASKNSRAAGISAVVTRGGEKGDEASAIYTVFENCINNGVISAKGETTIFAAGVAGDFYVNTTNWPGKDCRVKFINCVNTAAITAETTNNTVFPHAGGIGGYTGNGYTEYEFYGCINNAEIKSIGGKQDRAGGIVGTVYSGSATYIFDKCIASGALKSGTFSLANKADALATSTENADEATVASAIDAVKALIKTSETPIAGFDTAKGLPEPEITDPPVVDPPVSEPTGDSALIFAAVAIISLIGVAVISKRREN